METGSIPSVKSKIHSLIVKSGFGIFHPVNIIKSIDDPSPLVTVNTKGLAKLMAAALLKIKVPAVMAPISPIDKALPATKA